MATRPTAKSTSAIPAKSAPTAPVEVPKAAAKPVAKTSPAKPVAAAPKTAKAMPTFAAAALAATREPVKAVIEATAEAAPPIPPIPLEPPTELFEKVTQTMEKTIASVPSYDDVAAAGKANIDALVEANAVFLSGFQELSKEVFSLTQESLDHAAAATTALLGAKTLKDVMELNTGFAKSNYEKLLHNSSKLGELTVKLATATAAPLTARTTHVIEKAVRPLA